MNPKPSVNPEKHLLPAIELSHSPEDGARVLRLVNRFGIRRPDDSAEEAANRLASMALVLANIAAGHGRGQTDGSRPGLGVDFVVEGGFAGSDFVTSVINPVAWIQDRWERNILHDVAPDLQGRDKKDAFVREKKLQEMSDSLLMPASAARRQFNNSQREYCKQSTMEEALTGDPLGGDGEPDGESPATRNGKPKSDILMPEDMVSWPLTVWRRATLGREALEYPVIFCRTVEPAALQGLADRAHLGHLLVHSRIDSGTALEKLWKTLTKFGERGTFGRADGPVRVRANLALCVDTGLLEEALATHRDRLRSVSRMLWLVESAPGCDLSGKTDLKPDKSGWSFASACERQIRQRINFDDEDTYGMDYLNGRMPWWRSFLRERERHLPGISATALNLPAALCYGLAEMPRVRDFVDADELIAFAKWLVLRMVNRIAVAAAAGQDHEIERQAARVAEKLATDGPMKVRDLQRKGLRLTAGECRTALEWLAEHRIAAERNGIWGILSDSQVGVPS